jgi:hypothetical protein
MLRALARKIGVVNRLRAAWTVKDTIDPLQKEIRRLRRELDAIQASVQDTAERAARGDQIAAQVKLVAMLNHQQRELTGRLPTILDKERIAAHVRAAIANTTLHTDPYEHIVVDKLLPDDIYQLVIDALPPLPFFDQRDQIKMNLTLPMEFGPAVSSTVWNFMEEVIAQTILRPAVMEKFWEPLQRHYDVIFGPEFRERANALPKAISGGRVMLRRPGYHLSPHRDPKRSFVTCLLYLARPGDSETYGTQIFRVVNDREANYKQTYYPEQAGCTCELVKVVPFRPNTMLAFVNSAGAHGATIPADAPADIERYAYQFYVAPQSDRLSALIKELPKHGKRQQWQNKNTVTDLVGAGAGTSE